MTEPNLDRIAQFVVDLADCADGNKNGTVSAANFTRIIDILDRLDTPLNQRQITYDEIVMMTYDVYTEIDRIKGNAWIDTNTLEEFITDRVSPYGTTLNIEAAWAALDRLHTDLTQNIPDADDNYGMFTGTTTLISEQFIRNYAKGKVTFN